MLFTDLVSLTPHYMECSTTNKKLEGEWNYAGHTQTSVQLLLCTTNTIQYPLHHSSETRCGIHKRHSVVRHFYIKSGSTNLLVLDLLGQLTL